MRYLLPILSLIFAVSCSRTHHEEMSRFHEDGRVKPTVAIASILDSTSFDSNWSLSDELTHGIMNQIAARGEIFVHGEQESPFTQNPFEMDLSWMKREFHAEEFVAFLELVEHEFVPVKNTGSTINDSANNLNMSLRLRVVDLRADEPKIVLQEMIRDSYFIPKTLIPCDYSQTVYGTDAYRKSPMGIAHAGLIQQVASRINDYILLAKSR